MKPMAPMKPMSPPKRWWPADLGDHPNSSGRQNQTRYAFFGDEHGKLFAPPGSARPGLGSRIECVTPHCDPTVNLHDFYHVVRGDTLVDIWPVDARGKR